MTDVATTADLVGDVIGYAVTYRTPEEYLIGTVLVGFVIALAIAGIYAKAAYNDKLKGDGLSKSEYPFGVDYMLAILVTGVLGAFVGYFASGIVLGLVGQQEAPAMVYYAVAFFAAVVVGRYGWSFLSTIPDIIRDKLKITA